MAWRCSSETTAVTKCGSGSRLPNSAPPESHWTTDAINDQLVFMRELKSLAGRATMSEELTLVTLRNMLDMCDSHIELRVQLPNGELVPVLRVDKRGHQLILVPGPQSK
jgi:hypothetical protein